MQHLCTRKKKSLQRCMCFSVNFSKSYRDAKSLQRCTTVQLHSVKLRYITVALCKNHHALWRRKFCTVFTLYITDWYFFLRFCYVLWFSVLVYCKHSFGIFFSRMLQCTNTVMLHLCIRAMYNTVLGPYFSEPLRKMSHTIIFLSIILLSYWQ